MYALSKTLSRDAKRNHRLQNLQDVVHENLLFRIGKFENLNKKAAN